jgi:aryl-alcohol dehydrogenase-like predicted oxidoreductase
MNKISIPKTDLHASTLALGTDYFGSTVSRDLCMELMDHYIEAGGNVIDTAESYARWLPGGEYQSEKALESGCESVARATRSSSQPRARIQS